MTVEQLEGIANVNLTVEAETTSLIWETSTDWDNAVSENWMKHTSDVLEMAPGLDTFEDLSNGSDLPSPYDDGPDLNPTATSSRAWEGSLSAYTGDNAPNNTYTLRLDNISHKPGYVPVLNNTDTNNSNGWVWECYNENNNIIMRLGNDSNAPGWNDGNGDHGIGNVRDDEWVRWTVTFDWANDQFDLKRVELENGDNTQTASGNPFINSASEIKRVQIRGDDNLSIDGGDPNGIQDNYYDEYWGVLYNSDLTTNTKTFSEPSEPNLDNLSYSLNSQTITLDVIGSPGTGSEEIVTQTLDGATSYTLSWANTHTDFRVKTTMDSNDRQTSPTLSRIELLG